MSDMDISARLTAIMGKLSTPSDRYSDSPTIREGLDTLLRQNPRLKLEKETSASRGREVFEESRIARESMDKRLDGALDSTAMRQFSASIEKDAPKLLAISKQCLKVFFKLYDTYVINHGAMPLHHLIHVDAKPVLCLDLSLTESHLRFFPSEDLYVYASILRT